MKTFFIYIYISEVEYVYKSLRHFRSVGSKFDLGKSSLSHCVRRVIKALNSMSMEIISWPRDDRLVNTKDKLQRISGLSNVVGAIDGSHIEIPAPEVCFFYTIIFGF